jgi:hypothetical protein
MNVRKTLRGVEVRERRGNGGEERYAYRVRFQNARGERTGRTFDRAEDALDFRARLRLLKRAGDLPVLDAGRESLEQLMEDYWRLYAETRLEPATRKKVPLPLGQAHRQKARRNGIAPDHAACSLGVRR